MDLTTFATFSSFLESKQIINMMTHDTAVFTSFIFHVHAADIIGGVGAFLNSKELKLKCI